MRPGPPACERQDVAIHVGSWITGAVFASNLMPASNLFQVDMRPMDPKARAKRTGFFNKAFCVVVHRILVFETPYDPTFRA